MSETTYASKQSPVGASSIILAMAALGAACVLATGERQLLPDRLAMLILALGALAAFYYHSLNRSRDDAKPQATRDLSSRHTCSCAQASTYRDALPTWASQVEAARMLTEETIATLANQFGRMSQRVESAAAAAQGGTAMSGGLALLLGDSRQELEATVVSLRAALATKEALQYEMAELSRLTEQLRAMAQDLGNIAEQTNRVALDATLADRGEQGLAAIANEIRRVSCLSGETGKRIGETVEAVNAAIASSLALSRQYAEQDGATVEDSRQVIEHVIKRFRGATSTLLESSRELREESQAIDREITQVLVSLRFREHVTQVLGLVHSDLKKLQHNLAKSARRDPASASHPRRAA